MNTESLTDAHVQSSKKMRSNKEDQKRLIDRILRILDAGYDVSSIKILLEVRKDRISGCIMEIIANKHLDFSQYRQILPAKNLKCVFGIENSDYWESCRKPNGEITLKPANLHELRKSLNLCG